MLFLDSNCIRIIVTGITQGVGFRPFVYRLASSLDLKGHVRNLGGSEVEIVLCGSKLKIDKFIEGLKREKPPTALIESMRIEPLTKKQIPKKFVILPSGRTPKQYSQIPPDFAICDECLKEINDPNSRFFGYAFHSCAWCGPRYTIIEKIPYDRENTSMRDFPLCELCKSEYSDPENIRRFHAQGISCSICGPKLWLVDNKGEVISKEKDVLELTARLIDEGYIVAIKGIGGFHIAALATDDEVVSKLRLRKNRPQKPFAIMALDISVVRKIVEITKNQEELLLAPSRPIVLLPRIDSRISELVAPKLRWIGVMIAYSGIHYLLLKHTKDRFLIMTSGNPPGKPLIKDNKEALKRLANIADFFVLHNRRIVNRIDDSVIRFTKGQSTFIRRARGYVPRWIHLKNTRFRRSVVALGAELQNTAAIGFDDKVIPTQYLGDMDDLDNLEYLEEALDFLFRAYKIETQDSIIIIDKHPRYHTRLYAEKLKTENNKIVEIQHHRAHILSVLAENGVSSGRIVGIAIDGVGYGDDGMIWGGEVFFGEPTNLRRVGRLEYVPMPGGDLATERPIRMLIGFLSVFMDESEIANLVRSNQYNIGPKELNFAIIQAKSKQILTSSTGRFLDSVSAYLKICDKRTYEGEPAIKLESFSVGGKLIDSVGVTINRSGDLWVVDTPRILEAIINGQYSPRDIAYTAQYLVGYGLGQIAKRFLSNADYQRIFVSGGAAVNDIILKGISDGAGSVEITINKLVPLGDGGISLGQAFYGALIDV